MLVMIQAPYDSAYNALFSQVVECDEDGDILIVPWFGHLQWLWAGIRGHPRRLCDYTKAFTHSHAITNAKRDLIRGHISYAVWQRSVLYEAKKRS